MKLAAIILALALAPLAAGAHEKADASSSENANETAKKPANENSNESAKRPTNENANEAAKKPANENSKSAANAQANPLPYALWWSFPRDDLSAIEIDDPDLRVSEFTSRWQFVTEMQRCEFKRGDKLLKRREGTPLREVRIDALDGEGAVRTTTRCVMTLAAWRARLGTRLVERLDDELDAHVSFLLPRHRPPPPPSSTAEKPRP
ncbi:MAG TPA: hypothetical protein VFF06_27505 [Polyangia bacterium]|nr:hypothetical protein [Polyangia bacterium]